MIMTVWYLCAQDAKRLFAVVEKNGKGSLCGVVKQCAYDPPSIRSGGSVKKYYIIVYILVHYLVF